MYRCVKITAATETMLVQKINDWLFAYCENHRVISNSVVFASDTDEFHAFITYEMNGDN